ncbi:amidase domain-containing protein [Bacillus sp. 1P06AnD]|uniref:amidase domain-containing protein n=1 Tax=Bacillus sp. 1P06AnD TaxID=3132208 RepID=UPI0039A2B4C9
MKQVIRHMLKKKCEEKISPKSQLEADLRRLSLEKRKAGLLSVTCKGKLDRIVADGETEAVFYRAQWQYFIRQGSFYYIEEEVENCCARFLNGECTDDRILDEWGIKTNENLPVVCSNEERVSFYYDRMKAVQYAEEWWDTFNPEYRHFEDDCTNYISQCLRAGGAPMWGMDNRSLGWWYTDSSWSYSWAVANAFQVYLQHSSTGLRAKEVESPQELMLGDVICYDFEGDGRFNHNTIVVAKDAYGMPLVNAHTTNSRMRYWSYEDSTAYTPEIVYRFYHIVDDDE